MAIIILGHSRCSICKQTLVKGDTFLNIPNLQFDRLDQFYEQNDAGMHQSCFQAWSLAPRFRQRYHEFWRDECAHPRDRHLLEDGDVTDNGRI